jgi:cell division septation protein DedD
LLAASEAPSRVGGWSVQLGSFGDVANANQLVSRVSTFGYTASVTEFRSGNRTLHRVRVGGFATENEAQAAASSLSAHNIAVQVIPPE